MASLFALADPFAAQPKLGAVLGACRHVHAQHAPVDGRHLDPTAERRRRKVDRNLAV